MSQTAPNSAPAGEDKKPLIFAVDDEPMLLELMVLVLAPQGYRVRTFRDPDTAVRAFSLANPKPHVVITDYAMHQMNGMELINACRRVNPTQKIILVSGTVDETIFSHCEQKPDRFLAKPYQAHQLADLTREVLAQP